MTCEECRLHVSSLIDDEIRNAAMREVFQHLGNCDDCWTYYQRARRLHQVLAVEVQRSPQVFGVGERCRDDSPRSDAATDRPARPSIPRRVAKTTASFWLGAFVAFIVGVLMTLLLTPVNTSGSGDPGDQGLNGWNRRFTMNSLSQTGSRR